MVTNMYPVQCSPERGVFVARQVEAIARTHQTWSLRVEHVDTIASSARYLTGIRQVQLAIKDFAPDLVHVHYGLTQSTTVAWRGPLVTTFHGSDLQIPWQRQVSALLARRCTHAIVVSRHLAHYLPEHVSTSVIASGVDPSEFGEVDRDEARQECRAIDGEVVLGFPASPSRRGKRYDLFVEAVRLLHREMRVRTLVFAGVPRELMPRRLASVDCVLMTSDEEGSPVITKEALCCGTRVVGPAVGDLAEQLKGMSGCRVARSRSPRDLADAVLQALSEPAPDPAVGLGRFSIEREVSAVAETYARVLGFESARP